MFSERPLHASELLDALTYSAEPFELTDETKHAKNALDCARPFIEIPLLPTGIVSFAHATVKR